TSPRNGTEGEKAGPRELHARKIREAFASGSTRLMKTAIYSILKNFKSFRLYWILLFLVLSLAIPTIFLRGTFQQQNTVFQTNGLSNFGNMEGVAIGPTIWSESFTNLTAWSLTGSAPGILQLNNSLALNV